MQKNKLLENIEAGRRTSICQLYSPSATLVEWIGLTGMDCLLIDGEHGTFTTRDLDDMCRAAELHGLTPIARVPNIAQSTIQSYLDRGVMGILGPGIDTAHDARTLVEASRYPPAGQRGIGGAPRWVGYQSVADRQQIEEANSRILVVAFLEHRAAMDNLEEIMSVEGIDAYYVGPADMSLSLGHPGQIEHPDVEACVDKVRQAAVARGRTYLGDVIVGERASNLFFNGARAFLEANAEALK